MMRAFWAILLGLLAASPAQASLRLCDQTSYVIYAATAVLQGDVSVSGWTRIVPGSCATALEGDLAARAYYLYARSSAAHAGARRAWEGQINLCAKDTNFSLHMPTLSARCTSPDVYELPFAALQTHHMRSWTVTFHETPDLASLKTAEQAGLKRLLSDIGVKNIGSPKAIDAALAASRQRLHLAAGASPALLFDALETEAMRASVPAGYTICNDTEKTVWAAIAQQRGAAFVSRGWWAVGAGACAKVVTESIIKMPIYLRVERTKGVAIVSGPETFCITNIEFEIQGRGHCSARGLTDAGFAVTNTKGAAGFVAHISSRGLESYGSGTSK